MIAVHWLPSFVAFTLACLQITSHFTTVSGSIPRVIVTNDGPTIIGATTFFMANLSLPNQTVTKLTQPETQKSSQPTYMYEYIWKQWICGVYEKVRVKQNLTCNFTRTYKCSQDLGQHTVAVEVRRGPKFVVENETQLTITEHINANLSISQGMSCKVLNGLTTCSVVATNKSVDMSINIHDPSNFFSDATILYYWLFGDGKDTTRLNQPKVSHNYTKSGHYNITVDLTAFFPNKRMGEQKTRNGSLRHNLHTMDIIKNLTIEGNSQIAAGTRQKYMYNISCHASPPMDFCWYIAPITTHTSFVHSDVVDCNKTVLINTTWLVVDHYFVKSGGYNVGVYASNAVSSSDTNKNVYATGSESNKRAVLVIGILLVIVMCILCIVVINTYVRRRKQRQVEVANFDFQGQSSRSTLGTSVRQFFSRGTREEHIALSQDFNKFSRI